MSGTRTTNGRLHKQRRMSKTGRKRAGRSRRPSESRGSPSANRCYRCLSGVEPGPVETFLDLVAESLELGTPALGGVLLCVEQTHPQTG
jgi:hypothetical protein